MRRTLLPTVLSLFASTSAANAVGFMTQLSCASDYYAFCSSFPVGSQAVRKCMSDNGAKLSKPCINALIADGEISKEEVARRTAKIASTKVAPKPERKAVDQQAEPKPNVVRPSEIKQFPKQPSLVRETITLDQQTFVALKNRGPSFLSELETVIPSTSGQPRNLNAWFDDESGAADRALAGDQGPTEASVTVKPAAQNEKIVPSMIDTTRNNPTMTRAKDLNVPLSIAAGPQQKAFPIDDAKTAEIPRTQIKSRDYPPGKMSLGKKLSFNQDDEVKPVSSQTWLEYMKSRFSGSMNYEGVDAHFSKGE